MSMRLPLTHFEYVDDGMYNQQWNIYEANGMIFAQAFSQQAAEELFFAVNYMRGRLSAADAKRGFDEVSED